GDCIHRAHSRRLRAALWRIHRCDCLSGARTFSGANLSRRLATWPGNIAPSNFAVCPERDSRSQRLAIAALWHQAQRFMTEIRLETQALSRHFGALVAVRGIDFKLAAGARHALIGPNGAGKTTFINLLTGVLPPTRGRVLFSGRDITGKAQAERV